MKAKIQKDILLTPYTTFKIGGPAKYFVEAEDIDEVCELCCWAKNKNIPIFILGGGSNILFSDKGFGGLVIKIQDLRFKIQESRIVVGAGVRLRDLVLESANAGLSGLEWAVGIPGTVGGAIFGNAGAFGHSISESIQKVEVFDVNELRVKNYELRDCAFAYRDSIFKYEPKLIILGADFVLKKEKLQIIQKKIKEYSGQRTDSPSGFNGKNCAGCFFKNVEWKRADINKKKLLKKFSELKQFGDKPKISTGFLIDFLGLKNKRIGNAIVSDKHANFILNLGNAKAEDVITLADFIKDKIRSRYNFVLEEEVNLIGF